MLDFLYEHPLLVIVVVILLYRLWSAMQPFPETPAVDSMHNMEEWNKTLSENPLVIADVRVIGSLILTSSFSLLGVHHAGLQHLFLMSWPSGTKESASLLRSMWTKWVTWPEPTTWLLCPLSSCLGMERRLKLSWVGTNPRLFRCWTKKRNCKVFKKRGW